MRILQNVPIVRKFYIFEQWVPYFNFNSYLGAISNNLRYYDCNAHNILIENSRLIIYCKSFSAI